GRVLRRQADPDDAVGGGRHDVGPRLGDERVPVPQADEHPDGPPRLQLRSELPGDLQHRRAPSGGPVPLPDLLHQLRRRGPPPTEIQEIGLDVLQRVRTSECHQKDGGGHPARPVARCTRSVTKPTASGGVPGRMPWPRLKMWPGRPSARLTMSSTRRSISCSGAKSTTGSRFPCTALSWPAAAQPSSRATRQSSPTTSQPALAISGSSVEAPVPKWMRGTPLPARAAKIRCVYG